MLDRHTSRPSAEAWPSGPSVGGYSATPPPPTLQLPLYVALGCTTLSFAGLCILALSAALWTLVRPDGGAFAAAGPTVRLRAEVTSYMGDHSIGPGTTCELPVEQVSRPDGTTWCHVQLTCGGNPLYGSADQGFFECSFVPGRPGVPGRVVGQDLNTSSFDRDPSFAVDSDLRTFLAHDDGTGEHGFFVVTGTITSVE